MESMGVLPNHHCYSAILRACARAGDVHLATQLRQAMQQGKDGLTRHLSREDWEALMQAHVTAGRVPDAISLLADMQCAQVVPLRSTYALLLAGCARHGRGRDALSLLREMHAVTRRARWAIAHPDQDKGWGSHPEHGIDNDMAQWGSRPDTTIPSLTGRTIHYNRGGGLVDDYPKGSWGGRRIGQGQGLGVATYPDGSRASRWGTEPGGEAGRGGRSSVLPANGGEVDIAAKHMPTQQLPGNGMEAEEGGHRGKAYVSNSKDRVRRSPGGRAPRGFLFPDKHQATQVAQGGALPDLKAYHLALVAVGQAGRAGSRVGGGAATAASIVEEMVQAAHRQRRARGSIMPTPLTYSLLVRACCFLGDVPAAVRAMGRMKTKGFVPDASALEILACACRDAGDARSAVDALRLAARTPEVGPSVAMAAACVDACIRGKDIPQALAVLKAMDAWVGAWVERMGDEPMARIATQASTNDTPSSGSLSTAPELHVGKGSARHAAQAGRMPVADGDDGWAVGDGESAPASVSPKELVGQGHEQTSTKEPRGEPAGAAWPPASPRTMWESYQSWRHPPTRGMSRAKWVAARARLYREIIAASASTEAATHS
eukprot:jgi/Mesvir1/6859/Mv09029-RA.1